MPRHFFRRFATKRDSFRSRWYLAPFAHLLNDHNLWGIRRRTVVPAFSIGLFVAYMPFPGHALVAALLALLFRVNIPVAALTTFISNPLTIGPMFYLAHRLGRFILGMEPQPFRFELTLEWIQQSFQNNWPPLLLGGFLLGSILSVIGYAALDMAWRASLADYVSKKRLRRWARRNRHRD